MLELEYELIARFGGRRSRRHLEREAGRAPEAVSRPAGAAHEPASSTFDPALPQQPLVKGFLRSGVESTIARKQGG